MWAGGGQLHVAVHGVDPDRLDAFAADLKARVTLSLTAPRGWTALANGALAGADSASATTTFRFRETEPLSTYLIAFAAGPWATRRAVVNGRAITMYVRASRANEAEADSLIALNARATFSLTALIASALLSGCQRGIESSARNPMSGSIPTRSSRSAR